MQEKLENYVLCGNMWIVNQLKKKKDIPFYFIMIFFEFLCWKFHNEYNHNEHSGLQCNEHWSSKNTKA